MKVGDIAIYNHQVVTINNLILPKVEIKFDNDKIICVDIISLNKKLSKDEILELKPSTIKNIIDNEKINCSFYTSTMGMIISYLKHHKVNFKLSKKEMSFLKKQEIIDMYLSKKIKLNFKELSDHQLKDLDLDLVDGENYNFDDMNVVQLRHMAKNKIDLKGTKSKSEIVKIISSYFN
jgi:hypothetical protein